MWRTAQPSDDDSLVEMCAQLYREDPGPAPVPAEQMHATLVALRREPWRGRAVVLEVRERLLVAESRDSKRLRVRTSSGNAAGEVVFHTGSGFAAASECLS